MIQPLVLTLREIASATRRDLSTIHAAINAGHLVTYTVGRRRYASPAAVQAWLDFLVKESEAGRPVKYRPRTAEKAARS